MRTPYVGRAVRSGLAAGVALRSRCPARARASRRSVARLPGADQVGVIGREPEHLAGYLSSDVLTFVKKNVNNAQVCVPTVFQDAGRAVFHMQLKDPGSVENPIFPSPSNTITFTHYHLNYRRTDGRNTPALDVPYGFDGGMQLAIVGGNVSIGQLTLVRLEAKEEAPLKALIGGGGAIMISTIAEITFYGTDAAGRSISVTGYINVDFSDWGDPDC